jgi:hypothetical protein
VLRLCLLVLLAALTACDKPLTVEQQVIAAIREMESTIEAGERRAFMAYIAEDFSGQQEVMTRDQVQAMVLFQLTRHKSLQVQLFPIRVTETGRGLASASFTALVTGGPNWIPESGQLFEFDTRWLLVDNDWLLQSANWKPAVLEN